MAKFIVHAELSVKIQTPIEQCIGKSKKFQIGIWELITGVLKVKTQTNAPAL